MSGRSSAPAALFHAPPPADECAGRGIAALHRQCFTWNNPGRTCTQASDAIRTAFRAASRFHVKQYVARDTASQTPSCFKRHVLEPAQPDSRPCCVRDGAGSDTRGSPARSPAGRESTCGLFHVEQSTASAGESPSIQSPDNYGRPLCVLLLTRLSLMLS